MNQPFDTTSGKRSIWLRLVLMVLMAIIFHLCGTLLCFVVVIQFLIVLLSDRPNARLLTFGGNLANYLRQIVLFQTFAAEELPFPFSDWPSAE